MICHAMAQAVIEQHCDFACGRGDRFCFSSACRQSSVKSAQRGVTSTDGGCCQTQECSSGSKIAEFSTTATFRLICCCPAPGTAKT